MRRFRNPVVYQSSLQAPSKIKGVPRELIIAHCRCVRWEHSSKALNRKTFYDPAYVLATFGLLQHERHQASPAAVAALAKWTAAKKATAVTIYEPCVVEWIEWGGLHTHQKAVARKAIGCRVVVVGGTATIHFPNGETLVKRLTTNGFSFSQIVEQDP